MAVVRPESGGPHGSAHHRGNGLVSARLKVFIADTHDNLAALAKVRIDRFRKRNEMPTCEDQWVLYLTLRDGTRRFRHWNGTSYEYRDVNQSA